MTCAPTLRPETCTSRLQKAKTRTVCAYARRFSVSCRWTSAFTRLPPNPPKTYNASVNMFGLMTCENFLRTRLFLSRNLPDCVFSFQVSCQICLFLCVVCLLRSFEGGFLHRGADMWMRSCVGSPVRVHVSHPGFVVDYKVFMLLPLYL